MPEAAEADLWLSLAQDGGPGGAMAEADTWEYAGCWGSSNSTRPVESFCCISFAILTHTVSTEYCDPNEAVRLQKSTLTEVEGDDGVSWSRSQLSQVLRLLFEFGEESVSRLSAHRGSGAEEAAHVSRLEQGLRLLQGQDRRLLLDVTAGWKKTQHAGTFRGHRNMSAEYALINSRW